MEIAMLVIGIILLVFAVFLIVAVLMQQGKAHNLSGAIAGGAETFFGKSKAQSINKKLSILTTVVAIVFVLLVCTVYVMQPATAAQGEINSFSDLWGVLFGGDEEEEMPTADPHDHDGDGVADHAPEDHVDGTAEDTDAGEGEDTDATTDAGAGENTGATTDAGAGENTEAVTDASSDAIVNE
ncbi:MAG: preprotein translocase subunit SecG [Clostridia bacterium]|nr:preprotein translocase subunit SecG [Clostridia bacterium]